MGTIIIISVVVIVIGGVVVLLLVLMKKKGKGGSKSSSLEPGQEEIRGIPPVTESLSQIPPPGYPPQGGVGAQPPQAPPAVGSFPQTPPQADPQQGSGAGQPSQLPAFPPQNEYPKQAEEQEYNEFMVK